MSSPKLFVRSGSLISGIMDRQRTFGIVTDITRTKNGGAIVSVTWAGKNEMEFWVDRLERFALVEDF